MYSFSLFTVLLTVLVLTTSSEDNSLHSHRQKSNGGHLKRHSSKRTAVLWAFTSEILPFHFDLTFATLVNGGADNIDVHIFIPTIPSRFINSTFHGKQIYFHKMTGNDWKQRIKDKLGLEISYNIEVTAKKIADLKPMMGLLFSDLIPESVYSFWVFGDSDGFFGSYNRHIDQSALQNYDVITGFPEIHDGAQIFAGTPVRSTGM